MKVRPRFSAVLERINAQLGLLFLTYAVGLTQEAAGCGVCFLVRTDQVKPHLKVCEFVGGRERGLVSL